MLRVTARMLGIVIALLAAAAVAAADCPSPTDLHDGWTVAAPKKKVLILR